MFGERVTVYSTPVLSAPRGGMPLHYLANRLRLHWHWHVPQLEQSASDGDSDRLESAVYFGVECRQCERRLPLVEVISAPHVTHWTIPKMKPFRARCDGCGAERDYGFLDVIVFPGRPPSPDFDVHPVFKALISEAART
jgi:hypothetical protein